MNVRNTRARLCAVLFTSLFTSISFAQVQVFDRASLAGNDFIDWQAYSGGIDPTTIPSPANISTDGGMAVNVAQTYALSGIGSVPYPFPTNMLDGEFVYYPGGAPADSYNYVNPVKFTGFDGVGVCGFGTQIAPYEAGEYVAWIEAFDDNNASMGLFDITANTSDLEAAFLGIESTDPMHRIEVSIQSTVYGGGVFAAFYVINQVDLKTCVSEPEVPVVSCSGFEPPMDNFPVKAKKNRVFPLKMELFDADGFALTGLDLATAPVVDVMFTSDEGGDAIDVSDDVLSVGKASDGNQFVFEDGIWQFRLSSKAYSAAGTYVVTAVSGDELEYVIDPSCVTSFVK